MTGTSTLYVTVDHVNEHAPVFSSGGVYAFSFDEDETLGTVINTVAATDADSGGGDGTVSFIIDSGNSLKLTNMPKYARMCCSIK